MNQRQLNDPGRSPRLIAGMGIFWSAVRTPIGRVSLLMFFLAVLGLNASGFCYSKFRYYSDKDLIDAAVKSSLERHDPVGERSKMYSSLEEFYRSNPACCRVHTLNHWMLSTPILRVFGYYEAVVEVYYQISDTAERYRYYDAHVRVNACGRVLDTMGTAEQSAPRT
jgi:hypothetical protein